MVRLFVAYLENEILTNAKCIHMAFDEAVVNVIRRVRNPNINFYKLIPLPSWDVHGSIPLLDLP